jgi:SPP1 family predicted phage head-tail adaptor
MLGPKLRHRVDIEQSSLALDSEGRQVEDWETILTSDELAVLLPAEIVPLSGREFVAAQAVQAGITTRITVRWRDGITAAMRVVHGADIYNIKAVLPDATLRRHLTLMCEVGVRS